MKKLLAATAIMAAAVATNASAVEQDFPYWYLGLSGGGALQKDSEINGSSNNKIDWDTGYDASASLGYKIPQLPGFRIEGEYTYRRQDISGNFDGDARGNTAAANLYYDFNNPSQFTPYIGGGIGYSWIKLTNTNPIGSEDQSSDRMIYQGMAGIAYAPVTMPNVDFTLGYRYYAPFHDPRDNGVKYEFSNNDIEAGARFHF